MPRDAFDDLLTLMEMRREKCHALKADGAQEMKQLLALKRLEKCEALVANEFRRGRPRVHDDPERPHSRIHVVHRKCQKPDTGVEHQEFPRQGLASGPDGDGNPGVEGGMEWAEGIPPDGFAAGFDARGSPTRKKQRQEPSGHESGAEADECENVR